MTWEEKQLLLKDISARLPYKVKCGIIKKGVVRELKPMDNGINIPVNQVCDITLTKTLNTDIINDFDNDNIVLKPYLRPLSSMTEDEREEFRAVAGIMSYNPQKDSWAIAAYAPEAYDWLNAHHFDYRDLIPKGLALEALKGMYNSTNNV